MKTMKIVAVVFGAFVLLATPSFADGKDKAAARKKAKLEFMSGERDKRWSMEDEITKEEREFLDEARKAHRDAERKLTDEIAAATDAKGENEAHKHFTEAQAQLKGKRDEFQRKMEAKRKAFKEQAEKDRKAFEASGR